MGVAWPPARICPITQLAKTVAKTQYGWDPTTHYGSGTALHELGRVVGMEHEHRNPFIGIKWHEQAVYDALAQPPNPWAPATTYRNILERLNPQQVQGSTCRQVLSAAWAQTGREESLDSSPHLLTAYHQPQYVFAWKMVIRSTSP